MIQLGPYPLQTPNPSLPTGSPQASDSADAFLLRFGRIPEGDGAAAPPASRTLRALLPAGATSTIVDALEQPPPPLPTNAVSAILCACRDGTILAATSERAAAFTPKQQRYLEVAAALLE